MNAIDRDWLQMFDVAMKHLFAIDHVDAGLDDEQLSCFADLPPYEAAMIFGEKFDLARADVYWFAKEHQKLI